MNGRTLVSGVGATRLRCAALSASGGAPLEASIAWLNNQAQMPLRHGDNGVVRVGLA